jgi:hypothetical protein
MKTENANSGPTSATTSTPAPQTADEAVKAAGSLSESEYLTRQADEARAAISRATAQLKANLAETVDIAGWTRQYPWITLGTVAVAGFVATSAMVPSKEQQALKRLRAIESALTPSAPVSTTNGTNGDGKSAQKPSLFQRMAQEAIKALPGVLSAVATTLTAKATEGDLGGDQANPGPAGRYPSHS